MSWLTIAGPQTLQAADTFGNFHTLGIVLDAPRGAASADIKEVRLFMLQNNRLRRLLDPVQIGETSQYAVSVFDLQPGREYRFRAEFADRDGKLLAREDFQGRTRVEPVEPLVAAHEIHVAKGGDDRNTGTAQKPKRSLAAAFAAARKPGAHIIVHEGVYYEGGLPSAANGTAESPTVVRGAKGEKVVIDGSHEQSLKSDWKPLGNGYFSTPYRGKTWVVCVRDRKSGRARRLYPAGSRDKLFAKTVGKHSFATFKIDEAFFCTGEEILIYCPYFRPEKMTIQIAHQKSFVEHSSSNHVLYRDLTFRFFQGQVFYVNNSNDMTFRRCRFEYCALPIAVKRASHRLLVERCRFLDDCTRWGFLPKGMDDVDYSAQIELGAVYVHNPYEGRGMVIRNNVIDGLFDGVHLTPTGPASKVSTHETDFYNNQIVKVCDDLIEADGQCRNLRIFRNRMSNFLSGISLAQGCTGPTYVLYNQVSGAGNSSATRLPPHYEGYPVKTNGGVKYGQTGWAFFFHNTFHTTTPKTNVFRVQEARWRKLTLANNIWQGTRDGFVFWRDQVSPISMNRDIVHAETGALVKTRRDEFKTAETAARRLPFLRGAIFADPMFVDPGRGDFRLRAESPAIDSGALIPGVNDQRIVGRAADIGAIESGAAASQ